MYHTACGPRGQTARFQLLRTRQQTDAAQRRFTHSTTQRQRHPPSAERPVLRLLLTLRCPFCPIQPATAVPDRRPPAPGAKMVHRQRLKLRPRPRRLRVAGCPACASTLKLYGGRPCLASQRPQSSSEEAVRPATRRQLPRHRLLQLAPVRPRVHLHLLLQPRPTSANPVAGPGLPRACFRLGGRWTR